MPRYKADSKERVRDAIDFVELVNARTELRKSGQRRYTGLCPFHDERTPSFGIDPVEKLYHCFGCGEGGDVFKFVMETEGLDFQSALESLAERAGVELEAEEEDPRAAAPPRARAAAARRCSTAPRPTTLRVLWESREAAEAREYLLGRGLSEAALRQFRVGYSPSAWDTVLNASRRAGFKNEEVYAAGLAVRGREGRLYDVFRGKIMFPLADARGRVRGFGARAMRDGQGPKYVNTREGEAFSKGRQLFGADLARAAAAKSGSVVLAEGYTDVIALHQAGFANAVGAMGTALTPEQASQLQRLAPVVLLCLDADAAGQQAAARGGDRAPGPRRAPRRPAAAGRRPGRHRGGGGRRRAHARAARRVGPVRALRDRAHPRARRRTTRRSRQVGAVIKPLPQGILRDELIRLASSRLGISPDLVESAVRTARPPSVAPATPAGAPRTANGARQAIDRREQSERAFLSLCVALPELGEQKLAAADLDAVFTSPLTRLAAERLRGHLEHPSSVIGDAPELAELIPEIVLRAGQLDATPATLELEALQLDLHRLDREITAARTGGEGAIGALATERQKVLDAIRHRLQ